MIPLLLWFGYCPLPVTAYIRGHIIQLLVRGGSTQALVNLGDYRGILFLDPLVWVNVLSKERPLGKQFLNWRSSQNKNIALLGTGILSNYHLGKFAV